MSMYIRETQYADDIAIFRDSVICLQLLLTAYNIFAKKMGLRISTSKTETISTGTHADFYNDETKLVGFKYFGSYTSAKTAQ